MATNLAGIFMAPPATPAPRFITENPVMAGYNQQDELMRRREADALRILGAQQQMGMNDQRMASSAFDLSERQRRADEALALDLVQRRTLGMPGLPGGDMGQDTLTYGAENVTIPGQFSTSARGPDTYGPTDTSYTVAELPPPSAVPAAGGFDPVRYQNSIIQQESGGRVDARPIDPQTGQPRSSALGIGQFIDSTWLAVVPEAAKRIGLDTTGMSRQELLGLRTDPDLQKVAIQVYAEQNTPALRGALGRDPTEQELRLAHGFGPGGATKFLQADPGADAGLVAGAAAQRANPEMLRPGRTAGDVMARFGVTGGGAPAAAPEAAMTGDTMRGGDDQTLPTYGRPSGVTSQFDDPRMRRYREELANTPGGGKMLADMTAKELSTRDATRIKVFELAAKGDGETAALLAQELGMNINPAMLRSQAASAKIWDVLRTTATQDPAHAMEVIRNLKPGGSVGDAIGRTRDPVPRTYGRGLAGDKPIIRSVPGRGLYRIDPATGASELIVPVGDVSSPYKMRARAQELAVREAGNMMTPPPAGWIDQRAEELYRTFGEAAATQPAAASPAGPGMDAGGIPPAAVPVPPAGGAAPMAPGTMIPGGAAPGAQDDIFSQAQDAIRRGADPVAVQRRMEEMGAAPPAAPPGGAADPMGGFMGLMP